MINQKQQRILIIDDTPENIKYMQKILKDQNYDVRVAPNGRLGLKAASTEPPDIILLDVMMPDMNGYEVCEKLKANEMTHDTPVIFLSALDETWDKVKAFHCGGVDFVTKPFEPVELLQRVKVHLELCLANQELEKLNQYLQRHLDTIDHYVMTLELDTEGIITHASKAFCEVSGFLQNTIVGKSYKEICHPECAHPICKKLLEKITSEKAREEEIQIQKQDGSSLWVHIDISPKLNDTGKVIGYTAFHQDITDKQHLEQLAITDELTGLYNRREFNGCFIRELNHARRDGKYFALLIIDIDFFKRYNDTYGHQAGDKALQIIGQTMKKTFLRASDLTFRLGGEEFGVILTANNNDHLVKMAERFRKNLNDLKIPHEKNTASDFLTASVGIKIISASNTETPESIYREADKALYQAKELGRNRVETARTDHQEVKRPQEASS